MNKNYAILPVFILFAIGMIGLAFNGQNGNSQSLSEPVLLSDGPQYHSMVVFRKNDEVIDSHHNLLTDEGKKFLTSQMGGTPSAESANGVDQILLGNTTAPVAGSTSHPGEITDCGLTVQSITWSETSTGNMTGSYEWTSSCDNEVVNSTGLECSACGATIDYFAGTTFTDTTLQSDDKLNITWYVWVS